jgi:uncharacterized protein (DUF983 family)
MLHAHCPQCRLGHIFARWRFPGLGVLREECEVCGTRYAREHGYYLGAMYVSSALVILLIPLFLLLFWAVTPWVAHERRWDAILLAAIALVALLAPLITSASRVLWLHFDRYFDPD